MSLTAALETALPIAIDTMGGDLGPKVQVEGAVQALRENNVSSLLVGPEADLVSILTSLGGSAMRGAGLEIVAATDVIQMDDAPARAVMKKPDASLCVAYRLLEEGKAAAILSAGNSGAMMAAGVFYSGLLPGIKRPAIATLLPVAGESRPNVLIDAGANVDCQAHNLVQFAVMGSIYSATLFDVFHSIQVPRVGLLSNGSEAGKGTDIIRAAAIELGQLAEATPDLFQYIGYVEGRDVARRKADVIVCDGFVGNVLLKSMEGCVRLIYDELVHQAKKSLISKLAMFFSRGVYRQVFSQRFDYSSYGGAPLLGLRRLGIVLHGSSDERAVKNALKTARTFVESKMTEKITVEIAKLEALSMDPVADVNPMGLKPARRRSAEDTKEK